MYDSDRKIKTPLPAPFHWRSSLPTPLPLPGSHFTLPASSLPAVHHWNPLFYSQSSRYTWRCFIYSKPRERENDIWIFLRLTRASTHLQVFYLQNRIQKNYNENIHWLTKESKYNDSSANTRVHQQDQGPYWHDYHAWAISVDWTFSLRKLGYSVDSLLLLQRVEQFVDMFLWFPKCWIAVLVLKLQLRATQSRRDPLGIEMNPRLVLESPKNWDMPRIPCSQQRMVPAKKLWSEQILLLKSYNSNLDL